MKILMVLDHEFPPDIRVENEIASLHRAGHEIHVACFTRKGRPFVENSANCIIHRRNISAFLYKSSVACLKFPFYFNFWRQFLNQLFLEQSFDAIHIHDLPLAQVGFEMKRKLGIKLVLDLHENWPAFVKAADHTNTLIGKLISPIEPWETYEKEMVKKSDYVITVVEEMRDRLIANGADASRIIVTPNTIHIKEYKESTLKPDPDFVTLLYSGGIDNQRGLQIVIKALPYLISKNLKFRLWIVGNGRYENKLKKMVKQLKIREHVIFWGWQKHDDMFALIQQADIALIPYIRTVQTDCSSPNKLFQYMYASKPILASNCVSIHRILTETQAGICYEHNSYYDFQQKALSLFEVSIRKRYGENGHHETISRYNWDVTVAPLIQIYRQVPYSH